MRTFVFGLRICQHGTKKCKILWKVKLAKAPLCGIKEWTRCKQQEAVGTKTKWCCCLFCLFQKPNSKRVADNWKHSNKTKNKLQTCTVLCTQLGNTLAQIRRMCPLQPIAQPNSACTRWAESLVFQRARFHSHKWCPIAAPAVEVEPQHELSEWNPPTDSLLG